MQRFRTNDFSELKKKKKKNKLHIRGRGMFNPRVKLIHHGQFSSGEQKKSLSHLIQSCRVPWNRKQAKPYNLNCTFNNHVSDIQINNQSVYISLNTHIPKNKSMTWKLTSSRHRVRYVCKKKLQTTTSKQKLNRLELNIYI
jgi:hypothetical protein